MNAKVKGAPDSQPVETTWKDPKRYMWLLGPALPGIGLAALTGYALAPKNSRPWPGLVRPWCMASFPHWTAPLVRTRATRPKQQ